LKISDLPLLEAMSAAALTKIQRFDARSLASFAWSTAEIQFVDIAVFKAVGSKVPAYRNEFNSQDLSNITQTFAAVRVREEAVMKVLSDASIAKIDQFKPTELASTA